MTKDSKEKIIEIVSKYGFQEVPCSIPKNNFQYFKRGIYFKIYEISPKLFYFLRDKVSPIKFLKDRPDGSLFFSIKENGITTYELGISGHPFAGLATGVRYSISIGSNHSKMIYSIEYFSEADIINNLDKDIQNFPELKGKKRKFLLDQLC